MCWFAVNLRRFMSFCAVALACCGAASPAAAYTPQSKIVRALRAQAIQRLDKADHDQLGGKSLIAMAYYNEFGKKNHPKIQSAVAACQAELSGSTPETIQHRESIYSAAITCIFLCELDAQKYRPEIDLLLRSLEIRQRPYGAWGYPVGQKNSTTGDTSMTQYGVLCLWTANHNDIPISIGSATAACNWLLRTQAPSGAWGYQGNDPGVGGQPRSLAQSEIRHSMVAAGLGSLYVLADLLQLAQPRKQSVNRSTPSVLRKAPERLASPLSDRVDKDSLGTALDLGNAWFDKHFTYENTPYPYYYMYALERYRAFQEIVTGQPQNEPSWYNAGVQFLRREQKENGGWNQDITEEVDTAFALLFLQRSTRMKLDNNRFDGTLLAGKALPEGPWEVGEDGRIEVKKIISDTEQILERLETDADLEWSSEQAVEIQLSDDIVERAAQLTRLERLVRAGKFQPRFVAVKTLSRIRDLDRVPALIYALSDPDPRIIQQSRTGLRFISRNFNGFGLSDEPTETEKQEAISHWKQWYLSVQPEGDFWE